MNTHKYKRWVIITKHIVCLYKRLKLLKSSVTYFQNLPDWFILWVKKLVKLISHWMVWSERDFLFVLIWTGLSDNWSFMIRWCWPPLSPIKHFLAPRKCSLSPMKHYLTTSKRVLQHPEKGLWHAEYTPWHEGKTLSETQEIM